MQLQAAPPFFIIRINKQEQEKNRKFEDGLAISPNYVFMQHEVQNGEILSIGSEAAKLFPKAKISNLLIFHHFVTGKGIEDKTESPYLICTDQKFNYYNVTVSSYNGERNMTYGVWDGKNIIPHPDFIFLNPSEQTKEVVQENDILEIKGWSESRDQKSARMAEIKNQITELTKTTVNEDLKNEIERREKTMNAISKDINKKKISIFDVAYSCNPFKKVGILNIACHTEISFQNRRFIIAPTKFMHFGSTNN